VFLNRSGGRSEGLTLDDSAPLAHVRYKGCMRTDNVRPTYIYVLIHFLK